LTTQLVYYRKHVPAPDGRTLERGGYKRMALGAVQAFCQEAQVPKRWGVVYALACDNSTIRDSEYEASRWPEGSEL
jgi:hypothetical protein